MKGYHYLLNIGRFFNAIMLITEKAFEIWIGKISITSFIEDIVTIFESQVFRADVVNRIKRKHRLKLIAM